MTAAFRVIEPSLPASTPSAAQLARLRVAVVSDAAPNRNGVGSFYADLGQCLGGSVGAFELFSPVIESGRWRAGLSLPLPGDKTQKLCLPNPVALRRALLQLQPHAMVIATPGVYGLTGAYLAASLGVPAAAGFHTSFAAITDLYWPDSWSGKVVSQYFQRSQAFIFKRCQSVIVNCDTMREQAAGLCRHPIDSVPTPLATEFMVPPPPPSRRIARVLYAGRLALEKNLQQVIDAAAAHPELEFTLAGEGPELPRVQAAAARLPNLHWAGWVDRDGLRQLMDSHDALVLPSHFESFGTVALEAMARGRLALVSRHCGIAQWPQCAHGLTVFADDLTAALSRAKRLSPDALSAGGAAARSCAERWNRRCADDWAELLVRLASAGKR